MLNVAVKAARSAGSIINRAALDVEAVRISQKQVNDFVTEVDHASEKAIIETLLTAYPEHGILAEESGSQHGAKDADCVWIIDPLDGTTNFIHGFPVYCVSIALAVRGKVEQAVIYDPSRNDLFTATKGRGAYLNERRIRVSKRTRLQECLISTGFPFRKGDNFNAYLQMMGDVMQRTAGLRRPGAAALDLAYVAAGYADGFFETGPPALGCGGRLPAGHRSRRPGRKFHWRGRLPGAEGNAWRAHPASTASWSASWANTASSPVPATKRPCARPLHRPLQPTEPASCGMKKALTLPSRAAWPRTTTPRSDPRAMAAPLDLSATPPMMAPVPGHQGGTPGHARVLPHGRLLRAVLRRRRKSLAPARHHVDPARPVRRPAGGHGRRTLSFDGRLPRAPHQARRVGGDLRAGRRCGHQQGPGGAQGGTRGHPRHIDRQRTAVGQDRVHPAGGAPGPAQRLRAGLAERDPGRAEPGGMRA
jgi:fructose-1,6-bisphosphatase/inositol monophosphatase family enzyme